MSIAYKISGYNRRRKWKIFWEIVKPTSETTILDVGFADHAFGHIPVIDGWHAAWPIPGGPPKPILENIVADPKLLKIYNLMFFL